MVKELRGAVLMGSRFLGLPCLPSGVSDFLVMHQVIFILKHALIKPGQLSGLESLKKQRPTRIFSLSSFSRVGSQLTIWNLTRLEVPDRG